MEKMEERSKVIEVTTIKPGHSSREADGQWLGGALKIGVVGALAAAAIAYYLYRSKKDKSHGSGSGDVPAAPAIMPTLLRAQSASPDSPEGKFANTLIQKYGHGKGYLSAADIFEMVKHKELNFPELKGKSSQEVCKYLDKNQDGIITARELASFLIRIKEDRIRREARLKRLFKEADTDHDGVLSAAEVWAWVRSGKLRDLPELRGLSATEICRLLDKDKDGKITFDELLNGVNNIVAKRPGVPPKALTPAQQQAWLLFNKYDREHTGELTAGAIFDMIKKEDLKIFGLKEGKTGLKSDDVFNYFDVNHDGVITRDEFISRVRESPIEHNRHVMLDLFEKYDKDKDGKLSVSEVWEWHKSGRVNIPYEGKTSSDFFRALDKNQDGVITQDELLEYLNRATLRELFLKYDEDHDGKLTAVDVWNWYRYGEVPFDFPGHGASDFFKWLDADSNGYVELQEVLNKVNFVR